MNTDEQFAESLRTQVTQVAPRIDVDVTRVVPAARRRRAAQIGGVTLAMGLALGGGAWAATTLDSPALPGGATTMAVEPSPEPSGPPETSGEGDPLSEDPSYPPIDGVVVPPKDWREATYFHVVSRKTTEMSEDASPLGVERWYGDGANFELTAHGPELMALGNQVDFEGGNPISYTWTDIAELPTEPEALRDALRSRYHAAERAWAVPDAASRLATQAPASPELRAAAWELLTSLPDVEVEQDVRDSEGRLGTAATYEKPDTVITVIYDVEQNRPLERERTKGPIYTLEAYLTTELTGLPDEIADGVTELPDFTAMTREDAEVACLQKHLACTFEEAESDTVPEGMVISSDPKAGALVTWGAPVTVVLSTGS